MRRADREITDVPAIRMILDSCKVFRLAMCADSVPYVVPLNYGYIFENGNCTIYFHCAQEGKKLDIIRRNGTVCFEMDTDHELTTAETACGYGYNFSSIIGNGIVKILDAAEDKKNGLKILMKHQTGKDFDFTDEQTAHVAVCRIDVTELTAKKRTR
jgi:nitroimidazol reductase NimA-like FMN-containing flavoprotein (pyridoxamine 5'-phosphate oxidase superfamily)